MDSKTIIPTHQESEKLVRYSPKDFVNVFGQRDSNTTGTDTKNEVEIKKFFNKRGASPIVIGQSGSEVLTYYPKVNKMNTPSTNNSFQILDCNKSVMFNHNYYPRPISVGGKNMRPPFLEPEESKFHFPSKSQNIYSKSSEISSEPYKFPLFRTKELKEFKLSISPEPSPNENSMNFIKNPAGSTGEMKISRTQRIPMSIATRFPRNLKTCSNAVNQGQRYRLERNQLAYKK